ncbi:hypothetical protein N7527_005372 [Penicillium freii]|nr:hypothetical protein N7527_005372 [Penicillium freii]
MSTSYDGMRTTILVPDDAVTLENSGLHLPLTPVSISSSSDSFVSIPDHLVSLAALEHLGYNSETATRIWEYWTNWPPGEPKRETDDDGFLFIDVVEGHLDNSPDTYAENDAEWFHCMNLYGINRELQEEIMDPKLRSIRLTESTKSYCISAQYAGLSTVVERVGRLAYRLDQPPTRRVHPVISVQHLEPPTPDPFDRELPNSQPTFDDHFPEETDRHDVAVVLDIRVRRLGRYGISRKEYLIQWQGEPREQAQRVKESDAVGAEEKVAEFEERRRNKL